VKRFHCCAVLIALLAWQFAMPVNAEEILMARSLQPFPETMLALQESIRDHG
jgi:hypothetical protein